MLVVLSVDATPSWKSSATRCDITVQCWFDPGWAGAPNGWPTWWAMHWGDDIAFLRQCDLCLGWNDQVAHVEKVTNLLVERKNISFECAITGDGKNMHAGNPCNTSKCWICIHDAPLEALFETDNILVRSGAYLWRITVKRRVADYAHRNSRVPCIFVKRVRQWCHSKGCHQALRDIDPLMARVKEQCAGIPEVDRIAPRRKVTLI